MRTTICLLSVALFSTLLLRVPAAAADAPALPWTIDQEQEYVVMGLKLNYERKSRAEKSVDLTCTVTSTDEQGFTCAISRDGDTSAERGGWDDDLSGRTLEAEWGGLAALIKDATVGKKKMKVGKQEVEAITYSTTSALAGGKRNSVLYLAKEFPGVIVKRERWFESAKGDDSGKVTLTLQSVYSIKEKVKELTEKLPFSDDACRKFFVKGLVLTYELIDGQKLMPGADADASQAMKYTVEVLEVGKTSHTQKVPTRWENGQPVEFTNETVVWQEVLDSYSDYLDSGTVSNGNIMVGDTSLACVNVTGGRRSYGDFNEEMTLSFCKEYPSVLVYKQIVCTNAVNGSKSLTRVSLKSVKKP